MAVDVSFELEARPASVADWEDLLVRLELMPRAVQHAVDDAGAGDEIRSVLRSLVEREMEVSRWLLALSGAPSELSAVSLVEMDESELRVRFSALRSRTFAVVQRRGLDVWDWEGETERHGRRTVYQALVLLLRQDVQVLADLRRAGAVRKASC